MRAVDILNGALVVLVLGGVALLVQWQSGQPFAAVGADTGAGAVVTVVADHGGVAVPVGAYQRIASVSLVADAILPELVHVDRIVSITASHRDHHPAAFRTAHARALPQSADLEAILALSPDLILVSNTLGDPAQVARARELGIAVFELGPMQGRATFLPNIRQLGQLLHVPARAAAVADRLASRLDRLAERIPPERRRPAIYAAAYASKLYGGTVGSSYHDVLTAAGLVDVAAGVFPGQGWPALAVEDLLRLRPAIIVTLTGNAESLRALPGMDRVDARIVEIDGALLGDPSLMLPAAEALQAAVYGRPSVSGADAADILSEDRRGAQPD